MGLNALFASYALYLIERLLQIKFNRERILANFHGGVYQDLMIKTVIINTGVDNKRI